MKNYPKYIKNTLLSVIRDMAKHPEDLTYKRKLSFEADPFCKKGGHSLRDEMLDCLEFEEMLHLCLLWFSRE